MAEANGEVHNRKVHRLTYTLSSTIESYEAWQKKRLQRQIQCAAVTTEAPHMVMCAAAGSRSGFSVSAAL